MAGKEESPGFDSRFNTEKCYWPSLILSLSGRNKDDIIFRTEVRCGVGESRAFPVFWVGVPSDDQLTGINGPKDKVKTR